MFIVLLIAVLILIIFLLVILCHKGDTYPFKKMKKDKDFKNCYNDPGKTKGYNKK